METLEGLQETLLYSLKTFLISYSFFLFTRLSLPLTNLKGRAFENIVGKGVMPVTSIFVVFSQCLPPYRGHKSFFNELYLCQLLNPFPNDKFYTFPNWKNLQTTISNLIKVAESSPKG